MDQTTARTEKVRGVLPTTATGVYLIKDHFSHNFPVKVAFVNNPLMTSWQILIFAGCIHANAIKQPPTLCDRLILYFIVSSDLLHHLLIFVFMCVCLVVFCCC